MAGTGFEFLSRDQQFSAEAVITLFSLSIQKGSTLVQAYSCGSVIFGTRLIFHVMFVILQVAAENFFY